ADMELDEHARVRGRYARHSAFNDPVSPIAEKGIPDLIAGPTANPQQEQTNEPAALGPLGQRRRLGERRGKQGRGAAHAGESKGSCTGWIHGLRTLDPRKFAPASLAQHLPTLARP